VFRINIKLVSNPVAEQKIRENDSHCQSIVLTTMDRSIVNQLEKEKNSNFNVENVVVMFIYWCTIINYIGPAVPTTTIICNQPLAMPIPTNLPST